MWFSIKLSLHQESPNYSPRAKSGPPSVSVQPPEVRMLVSFPIVKFKNKKRNNIS